MERKKQRFKSRMFGIDVHEAHWETQEWNLNTRTFEIYLVGETMTYHAGDTDLLEPGVEYQMSTRLIKNLRILNELDPQKPILIHMKTCGGFWEEGMAIFDAIYFCPNPIVILSYTHARSMSSLILQAADRRILMPHSYFLIHEGSMFMGGTVKQFLSAAEWEKRNMGTMLDIYVAVLKRKGKYSRWKPGRIREELQSMMDKKEDVYFTAEEAVKCGFADGIFDGNLEGLKKRLKNRIIITPNMSLLTT